MSEAAVTDTITITIGIIACWRLIVILQNPSPTRARIFVFLLFAASFVANATATYAVQTLIDSWASGLAGLLSDLALLGFFVGFVIFFGGTYPDSWYGKIRAQLHVVAIAAALLVGAWGLSLPSPNSLQYVDLPPDSAVGPILFSLVSNLYLAYGAAASAYLAGLETTRTSRSGRVAFGLCSLGMVLCFVGGPLVRIPATVLVWTRTAMAPGHAGRSFLGATQGTPFMDILGAGLVLVAAGLVLVATRTVAGKGRLFWDNKSKSLALYNLWRQLMLAFPRAALYPNATWLGTFVRVREVEHRAERFKMECRDGGWAISEYIEEPEEEGDDSPLSVDVQAQLVRDALVRYHHGLPKLGPPVAIAAVGSSDERKEEDALLALARSFTKLLRKERRNRKRTATARARRRNVSPQKT